MSVVLIHYLINKWNCSGADSLPNKSHEKWNNNLKKDDEIDKIELVRSEEIKVSEVDRKDFVSENKVKMLTP